MRLGDRTDRTHEGSARGMHDEARLGSSLFLERGETCGNRFALLDCRAAPTPSLAALQALAKAVCDQSGAARPEAAADDLLVVVGPGSGAPGLPDPLRDSPGLGADARLIVIGADGRVADLCGNGLLYAAAALAGGCPSREVVVESVRGLHMARAENEVWSAVLEMPRLLPGEGERMRRVLDIAPGGGVRALDSGEPHVVIDATCVGVRDPLDRIPAEVTARLAGAVASSPVPGGVNVDLVSVAPDGTLRIRTWERGVRRHTESCGTGAAAAAWVLANDRLLRGETVDVRAAGGDHRVRLDFGRLRIAATPRRGTRRAVTAIVEDDRVTPALRAALSQLHSAPPADSPA